MARRPRSKANGEGSIYRRADGLFAAELMLGTDPLTGKKKVWRKTSKLRKVVAAALAKAQDDRGRGALVDPSSETVGEYLQRWLRTKQTTVRARAYEAYALAVRRAWPYVGAKRLTALSEEDLEVCYAGLATAGLRTRGDKAPKPLAARTIYQTHSVLHNALDDAVGRRKISRNPADYAAVPRPVGKPMLTLTQDEAERLFDATKPDRFGPLWVLLVTTGLRLGEALGLHWSAIDPDRARLVVVRSLQRHKDEGLVEDEPKTAASRRSIHLSARAVGVLREHRRRQNAERLASAGWEDRGLVFCTPTGGPIDGARIREQLRYATKRAKVPDVTVHELRHTCATLLLTRGVHPKIVQELLGHSTIAITLNLYSHVIPALHGQVATEMDALFGGAPDRTPAPTPAVTSEDAAG